MFDRRPAKTAPAQPLSPAELRQIAVQIRYVQTAAQRDPSDRTALLAYLLSTALDEAEHLYEQSILPAPPAPRGNKP